MTSRARISWLAAAGLVPLLIVTAGCAHPARQRLIGTWQVSFEMSKAELDETTAADNPLVTALGQLLLSSLRTEMTWEFRGDDTMTATVSMMGKSFTRVGTWKFVRGTADTTTITAQFEGDQPRELTFRFPDDDTLEAAPYAGGRWQINRLMKFKRLGPP